MNRNCKICGCDISSYKSNAIICHNKTCQNKYATIRKATKDETRYCEVCNTIINHLPRQRKICENEECIRLQKIKKYHESKRLKKCIKCGKEFNGTLRQKCCETCRNTPTIEYETIEVQQFCKYCHSLIKNEYRKLTSRTQNNHFNCVCEQCKEEHRKETSLRMKLNNPMFNKETAQKVSETKRENYLKECEKNNKLPRKRHIYKGESKKDTILRMKLNNPMFNKETAQKVSETLKKRYNNGEIKKYFGKDNRNWKGNRNLNKAVRIALRNWVKDMFIKHNFQCQKCGKTKCELHVHHIESLHSIINNFLITNNITTDDLQKIEGTKEYFNFINGIVKYHYEKNDIIGIVVCKDCHSEIDKQYRPRKNK